MPYNTMFTKEKKDIRLPKIKFWCENYPGKRCPTFMEPFILLCLYQKPLCGYEIIHILKDCGINYKVEEYGFFYKTLNIMKEKGFILPACSLDNKTENVCKIMYFISDKGESKLKEWVFSLNVMKNDLDTFLNYYDDFYKK